MSKNLAELCAFLVDEIYGHLPSRLFSLLTSHGRLPLSALVQRSRLPPRFVQSGLAILVQNQLVLYYASDEDNAAFYEANTRNAYDLIRTGKDVYNVQISLGDQCQATYVVENLLFQGPSSASDVFDSFNGRPEHKLKAAANGGCNGDVIVNGAEEHSRGAKEHINGGGEHVAGEKEHTNGEKEQVEAEKEQDMEITQPDATGSAGASLEMPEQLFTCRYGLLARQMDYMSDYDFDRMVEAEVLEEYPFQGEVKGKDRKAEYALAVETRRKQHRKNNMVKVSKVFGARMPVQPQLRKRDIEAVDGGQEVVNDKLEDKDRPQKLRKLNRGRGYDVNGVQNNDLAKRHADAQSKGQTLAPQDRDLAMANGNASYKHDEVAIRMNHDKFDMMRRHNRLATLAARSLGEAPAKVYAALLRCVTKRVDCCFDDTVNEAEAMASDSDDEDDPPNPLEVLHDSAETSPEISMPEIVAELDIDDILPTLVEPNKEKAAKINVEIEGPKNGKHRLSGARFLREDGEDDLDDAFDSKKRRVKKHIKQALGILSEAPYHFVHATAKETETGYRVNFPALCGKLIQLEIERLINARFGSIATRIVRYLRAKGKMEEKSLASSLLLGQKELRASLGALQEAGVVDAQEIPRDGSRQPNRTIYLWFFDQERVRKIVLEDTYKVMCRLLQRTRVEKEKVQGVVEKSERTDVRNDPGLLSEMERKVLHDWEEREEKLLVQVGRLDDLVAVLRDFLPPPAM